MEFRNFSSSRSRSAKRCFKDLFSMPKPASIRRRLFFARRAKSSAAFLNEWKNCHKDCTRWLGRSYSYGMPHHPKPNASRLVLGINPPRGSFSASRIINWISDNKVNELFIILSISRDCQRPSTIAQYDLDASPRSAKQMLYCGWKKKRLIKNSTA